MRLNFIVGTGRCGSSLVHEILANHEGVGFVSNIDDNLAWLNSNGRFNNRLYAITKGSWTRKGRARFAPSEAYRLIGKQASPIFENSSRDLLATDVTPWLRKRFADFFATRWRAQRCQNFLHKYTGWSRIGFFAEIFPESRFVHIVRDGRAVANSMLQMPWWGGYRGPQHWLLGPLADDLQGEWDSSGASFVTLAALTWRVLMDSYQSAARTLPAGRYLEIRYEDVLAQPEESLRAICGFIGLDWSKRLSRASARILVDISRERAFERDLSTMQIAQMEQCIGPLLSRYGYR